MRHIFFDVYLRHKICIMVYAKKELFSDELQECAGFFKALSHPARIQILKYLAEIKTCITGDISEELPLSRTTVNQHLAELKRVGLIRGQVTGVKTNYCIDPVVINKLNRVMTSFLKEIKCCHSSECL